MTAVQLWVDALNRGDLSVANEVFAHDCIVHITGIAEPIVGVGAWTQVVAAHTQPLGPIHATGRAIALDGLILDHFVGDKVVQRWEQWDQSVMMQQLGVA